MRDCYGSRRAIYLNVSELKLTIRWWEKKRLLFNLIIVSFSIFSMYSYWDYPVRTFQGGGQIIFDKVIFMLFLNALYTISWAGKVFYHRRDPKNKRLSNKKRRFYFTVLTALSLLLTDVHHTAQFDVLFAY